MKSKKNHISVCICTYKRPYLLKRLLVKLTKQKTEGLFSYSVVVADNDYKKTAKHVVSEFAASTSISVTYCFEAEQNIALARNKTLENAKGDFIAFIDDDEIPAVDWLYNLFKTCNTFGVDGVLGPVKPYFDHNPPRWIVKLKSVERPAHNTGYEIDWPETRTGNVLFKKKIIDEEILPFRPEFGTGSEDVDFFRRMMEKGGVFVWCDNAVVNEIVPPARCKRSYQVKLALLRGGNSLKHRQGFLKNLLKAIIAIPVYGLALPLLFVLEDYHFMNYLIKFSDHLGRILALMGVKPIKDRTF